MASRSLSSLVVKNLRALLVTVAQLGAAVLAADQLAAVDLAAAAQRPGWDPAVGAFEHSGSDRTSVFANAQPFAASSGAPVGRKVADLPGVWSTALDSKGRVFVLGGVVAGPSEATPFVSRYDAEQQRELWRASLPIPNDPNFWNYPGGIGIHQNGFIYVVYATRFAKLDPATGKVVATTELPAPSGLAHTAYNGFVVLSDGTLLTKSHHRKPDCPTQGFRAFIVCGVDGLPSSALVMIDPATLNIVWSGRAEELIGGRITAVVFRGREYVYLAGVDKIYRMKRSGKRLIKDTTWGPVTYRQGLETGGTAAVGFGDWVLIQTNALPTSAPMRLVAISQADSNRRHDIHPFSAPVGKRWSFMPSKASADWDTRRVYTSDAYGGFAALDFDPDCGFSLAWNAEQFTGSFISLLGDREARVLVATDIGAARSDEYGSPRYPSEELVWRSAADGRELGRVRNLPRNFGLTLVPTTLGAIYYASGAGGLWYVTPPADPAAGNFIQR